MATLAPGVNTATDYPQRGGSVFAIRAFGLREQGLDSAERWPWRWPVQARVSF
jgi:hypothetical protein